MPRAKLRREEGMRQDCSVPEVETSRDGAVLTITLNRPDVLNAFNKAMHDGSPPRSRTARP